MKVYNSKGKTVFVATSANDRDNCPRLVLNEHSGKIRDDYRGVVKINYKLLSKLF